jgi:hypothetical protein
MYTTATKLGIINNNIPFIDIYYYTGNISERSENYNGN